MMQKHPNCLPNISTYNGRISTLTLLLPAFDVARFTDLGHFNRYVVILSYCFQLKVSNDKRSTCLYAYWTPCHFIDSVLLTSAVAMKRYPAKSNSIGRYYFGSQFKVKSIIGKQSQRSLRQPVVLHPQSRNRQQLNACNAANISLFIQSRHQVQGMSGTAHFQCGSSYFNEPNQQ